MQADQLLLLLLALLLVVQPQDVSCRVIPRQWGVDDVTWPPVNATSSVPTHVFGEPQHPRSWPAASLMLRRYHAFSVLYDERILSPRWAAIKVTHETLGTHPEVRRPRKFKSDPVLEQRGLAVTNHKDYAGENWDRGHQVRFYDAKSYGREAGLDTFYTSNICPQRRKLNQQAWQDLEEMTDAIVATVAYQGEAWIITGPVYQRALRPFTPGKRVPLPDAFFRVIIWRGLDGVAIHTLAFLVPHRDMPRGTDMSQFLVSIDALEHATDLDFLPGLRDDIEAAVENTAWSMDKPPYPMARPLVGLHTQVSVGA